MKVAKIVNNFGKTFLVPVHKAKSMSLNWQIEDFTIVEVDRAKNIITPQTQREFEQGLDAPKAKKAKPKTVK